MDDSQLSRVNTALLMAGVALLLVAFLGRWVTIASNQILQGAPWWVQVVLGVTGLLAIAWAGVKPGTGAGAADGPGFPRRAAENAGPAG